MGWSGDGGDIHYRVTLNLNATRTVEIIRRFEDRRVVRTPAASIARLQSSHMLTAKRNLNSEPSRGNFCGDGVLFEMLIKSIIQTIFEK